LQNDEEKKKNRRKKRTAFIKIKAVRSSKETYFYIGVGSLQNALFLLAEKCRFL